jgi:hypothetical protein
MTRFYNQRIRNGALTPGDADSDLMRDHFGESASLLDHHGGTEAYAHIRQLTKTAEE